LAEAISGLSADPTVCDWCGKPLASSKARIVTDLRESEGERLSTLARHGEFQGPMGTNRTAGIQSWSIRVAIEAVVKRDPSTADIPALAFVTWLLVSSTSLSGSLLSDCARKGADGNWNFPVACPNGRPERAKAIDSFVALEMEKQSTGRMQCHSAWHWTKSPKNS
jgi:hypothetical protein